MLWPSHIRLISLPSIVCCTLFLWNALVYLNFARRARMREDFPEKYFYFGFTSLALALYSFGTFNLYSSDQLFVATFWQRWQLACTILIFICFVLFSVKHLQIRSFYLEKILPLVSLLFLPFVFIGEFFFHPVAVPKKFIIFSYSTQILEADIGPVAIVYFAWLLANLLYLAKLYFRYYEKHRGRSFLFVALIFFMAAAVNDIFVASESYTFFYLLEWGFVIYILAWSFQLFDDYLAALQEVVNKTEEVQGLNEEMNFLVRTISHDFRAPLISVQGFVQILQEKNPEDSAKSKDFLRRIGNNADRMLDLLEDLSTYLKIGRVSHDDSEVNLNALGDELWDLLVPRRFPDAVAEWDLKYPVWHGSEKRLRQILMNLMENALKYSNKGKEWVRIASRDEKGGLLLTVEDRGLGVPEDCREKVFEPFFRQTNEVPGTGLGLAIVKKASEDLGGRAWIDSREAPGTLVCVWLPTK